MRKADYATLAQLIREKRNGMQNAIRYAGPDEKQALIAGHVIQCTEDIARDFARVASVNREAFLKACGID